METWRPLFTIRSSHEYFSGDECTVLDITPTPDCRRLLSNANLLLRKQAGGLTVHAESEPSRLPAESANFDFHAHVSDPVFWNYTDGVSAKTDAFTYLSNTNTPADAEGRLCREAYVSGTDRLPPEQIPPTLLPQAITPPLLIRVAVDFRDPDTHTYLIPMRARRTTWQYFLSGTGLVGSDLYVSDAGGEEPFDYSGEVDLPNGMRASRFQSKSPLPLLQSQPLRLSLRERHNGRTVVSRLPVPSPRQFGRERINGEEIVTSQMFVNL